MTGGCLRVAGAPPTVGCHAAAAPGGVPGQSEPARSAAWRFSAAFRHFHPEHTPPVAETVVPDAAIPRPG